MINAIGPFFGSEGEWAVLMALDRCKGGRLWTWARRAQYPKQLPPSSEGQRIRPFRVLLVRDQGSSLWVTTFRGQMAEVQGDDPNRPIREVE
ncbi:hypothetical protein PIB30_037281 [Stylosanthes scabra]|uniref:Uncharacterized protein n=1 Tax=Stylosanthes scabra TaxID=79078 RepID=A0ABU6VCB8_9FABA|nr:hypothetical protein [Stylosanthes scabra]